MASLLDSAPPALASLTQPVDALKRTGRAMAKSTARKKKAHRAGKRQLSAGREWDEAGLELDPKAKLTREQLEGYLWAPARSA